MPNRHENNNNIFPVRIQRCPIK